MTTSQKQISLFTEETLTSSQEAFHASRLALQASERARKILETSGRNIIEQSGRFNRLGSSGKMFLALLIGQTGWSLNRCRLTWKLKGTKLGRLYFQLAASAHPTKGKGFGLLPTPRVGGQECYETRAARKGHIVAMSYLESAVQYHAMNGLLPTPTVMDTNCGDLEKIDQRREKAKTKGINGNGFGVTIGELANRGLLPTPTLNDSKNATMPDSQKTRDGLTGSFHHLKTGQTSQLNPRFVMEMMGFPPDWTELPFLNGETNQSKQQEMP